MSGYKRADSRIHTSFPQGGRKQCSTTMLLLFFLLVALVHVIFASTLAGNKLKGDTKITTKRYSWELDSAAMLSKSSFKIKPAQLIERAKAVVDKGIGLKNPDDLSEEFVFQFPIVGPLSKSEYLSAVGGFSLGQMFPDFDKGLYYDFRVDPLKPNRVWFQASFSAVHSGEGPFGKPTGITVTCPPQAISLSFDEKGKVVKYTGGYVMDKEVGNSGGMGGIFGPLYAIGKPLPFPEARPWSPSLQYRVFNFIGNVATKLSKKKSDA